MFSAETLPPALHSNSTVRWSPPIAAMCNGVDPSGNCLDTDAPRSSKTAIHALAPVAQQMWSGVAPALLPVLGPRSTSAPASRSRLIISTAESPRDTVKYKGELPLLSSRVRSGFRVSRYSAVAHWPLSRAARSGVSPVSCSEALMSTPFDKNCFTFSVSPALAAATVSAMRFFSPPKRPNIMSYSFLVFLCGGCIQPRPWLFINQFD